jgi:hypothetical protein
MTNIDLVSRYFAAALLAPELFEVSEATDLLEADDLPESTDLLDSDDLPGSDLASVFDSELEVPLPAAVELESDLPPSLPSVLPARA